MVVPHVKASRHSMLSLFPGKHVADFVHVRGIDERRVVTTICDGVVRYSYGWKAGILSRFVSVAKNTRQTGVVRPQALGGIGGIKAAIAEAGFIQQAGRENVGIAESIIPGVLYFRSAPAARQPAGREGSEVLKG